MRTFIDAIGRLHPRDAAAILEQVLPEDREAIARAGPVAWLDASINLRCTQAVYTTLSEAGSQRFFRGLLTLVYDTSLFATFVRGIVRLFGRDLGAYCRWIERGFGLAFRDVGHWSVGEVSPTHARMHLRELPVEFSRDPYWLDSVSASLGSLLDLAEVQGRVRFVERLDGGADFDLAWLPRR